ncbi:MAG: hypothetical protein V1661_01075 [bacterium]
MKAASVILLGVFISCESGMEIYGSLKITAPIIKKFGAPVVKGTINNRPANILLDTAVESEAYISATFLDREKYQNIYEYIREICIETMCFKNVYAYQKDTFFTSPDKDKINAIIGIGLLKNLRFGLDKMQTASLEQGDKPCGGDSSTIQYNEFSVPLADITIGGLKFDRVPIDTGAVFSLFSPETAAIFSSQLEADKNPASACDIYGCKNGFFISSVANYCLGEKCADRVAMKYPAFDAAGCSYLKNYNIIFDFPNNKLIFCK